MHHYATGTADLVGGEPPLSPETIGRAPSSYDAPVPVIPLEELVRLKARAAAPEPVAATIAHTIASAIMPAAVAVARRRVVVRLLGGEEVELGSFDGKDEALEQARTLAAELGEAEQRGHWPEIGGRHLRPASILSVDVLALD
jgi:hypothetical protein